MAIKFGRPLESKVRFVPVKSKARAREAPALDLASRPRRTRRTDWARRLVREHVLTADDLIWPVFVTEGSGRVPVDSMPGVERLSLDEAVRAAERAAGLSIPVIALFPYTEPSLRHVDGSEALNPANLVRPAIPALHPPL